MPLRDLKTYLNQMPRLMAEDSLGEVEAHAIGSGSVKQYDAQRRINEWQTIARGEQVNRHSSQDEIKSFIKGAGIKVK